MSNFLNTKTIDSAVITPSRP